MFKYRVNFKKNINTEEDKLNWVKDNRTERTIDMVSFVTADCIEAAKKEVLKKNKGAFDIHVHLQRRSN